MSDFTLDSLLSSLSDNIPETTGIDKTAADNSVAQQLKQTLTKEASDASTIGDTNMSVETGNAIANMILSNLTKQASANKVVQDVDTMVAQHDARILATPRQGKTVTEVAMALQDRAPAGSGEDEIGEEGSEEGNAGSVVSAVPSDIEKAAAVNDLLDEGYEFNDAVEMVKEAAFAMAQEAHELEKVAAVNALLNEGYDFEDAVELVKQASAEMYGSEDEYTDLEKAAAVNDLMNEDGLSFDEAVDLIKQAALSGK